MEPLSRIRSAALWRRVAQFWFVWMLGVGTGALVLLDPAVVPPDALEVIEGTPLVISEPSRLERFRRAIRNRLTAIRESIDAAAMRATLARRGRVEASWLLETNFLTLRIDSLLTKELAAAAEALHPYLGSLSGLSDDRFVVVTRDGSIFVHDAATLAMTQSVQLQGVNPDEFGAGIRDVALLSSDGIEARFVASYARSEDETRRCTRVGIATFSIRLVASDAPAPPTDVTAPPPEVRWTNDECVPVSSAVPEGIGGRLLVGPPGRLYLTLGDMTTRHPSQSILGTLLEFPWQNSAPQGAPRVVSRGFRNPSGLARAGDDLYVVNQGPKGGDTLNRAVPDTDFGWPQVSYGAEYGFSGYPSPANSIGAFDPPSYVWVPSPAVSDLDVNRTPAFDGWFNDQGIGDLLVTSLKGRSLYRCRLEKGTASVAYCEKIFIGERLRDVLSVRQSLIVLSDTGHLYRIVPAQR